MFARTHFLALVLTLSSGALCASVARSQTSQTLGSLQSAIQTAAAEHKPLLVKFYADWCGPCRVFNEDLKHDAKLKAALNGVVLYTVNFEQPEGAILQLGNRFDVTGLPVFALISPKTNTLARKWSGYNGVEDIITELDKARRAITQQEERDIAIQRAESVEKCLQLRSGVTDFVTPVKCYRAAVNGITHRKRRLQDPLPKEYSQYVQKIFKNLMEGRMNVLAWNVSDPLDFFNLPAVLAAANSTIGKSPSALMVVLDQLHTLSLYEDDPSFLKPYLVNAHRVIQKYPELLPPGSFIEADYAALIEKDSLKGARLYMEQLGPHGLSDSKTLLNLVRWFYVHRVQLKDAVRLAEGELKRAPDNATKEELFLTLARIKTLQKDSHAAANFYTQAMALSKGTSRFKLYRTENKNLDKSG